MTDAALAVTQSVVEQFAQRYLESLGCSIDVEGKQWTVTVPEEADTIVDPGELTLVRSAGQEEPSENERLLHPESAFFQELMEEAADRAPIGSTTLAADDVDVQVPGWATESDVEVTDVSFAPYYDRTALTVLFHVSIETVSEYQTQLLRAISIDTRSGETVPGITREYLDRTATDNFRSNEWADGPSDDRMRDILTTASEEIRERVQPTIDDVHENASRAADVELEDYRRLQEQRIGELDEKISTLTDRIAELCDALRDSADEAERMDALRQRKRLKTERGERQEEVGKLRRRREAGFPEKQREIRDRHALTVRIEPVGATLVEYETGELTVSLASDATSESVTVGYGTGAGVIETITCDRCERALTSTNPVQLVESRLVCSECVYGHRMKST